MDLQLAQGEVLEYRAHLSICAACRNHLDEIRQVSFTLKSCEPPDVPRELHSYIMATVERRMAAGTSFRHAFEWLLSLNPMPVSYVAGVVLSVMLFTLTLLGFKPIPVIGSTEKHAVVIPVITGSYPEYQNYNDLPTEGAHTGGAPYYELPRVLNNSALVSFNHLAQEKEESDGMYALVEVGPDGRAELVDMLDAPQNPQLVEELWWVLGKPIFQPAIVKGRAVPTRIILFVEQVDIHG